MTRLLVLTFTIALQATAAAAESIVFLVRHAERADTATSGSAMTTTDPDLSAAGRRRAQSLATMLKDAKIRDIYTTEYKRTQQTAAPLAKVLGVTPIVIPSKDLNALVQRLKKAPGNVLVVGHSNTLPDVVKALGVSESITIDESEFDSLFVVTRAEVVRLHFGR